MHGDVAGNTADVNSLISAIDRLQRRFRTNRVCVVADRGMISAATIAELEARGRLFSGRARANRQARARTRSRRSRAIRSSVLMKPRREVDYEAKAVTLAGPRYIVCRNLDEMKKAAANRATIVAALERQLKKGDKSLVGNKGYRRFLKNPQGEGFAIDRAKVEEDQKFDGVFVLRTNADLPPLEAMLVYKQLWTVDIDQSWRLSRLKDRRDRVGTGRRQAPWKRRRSSGFELRYGGGVGRNELRVHAAELDRAAA